MKILDVPQTGKKGIDVSMQSRYGQVKRTLAIPANPRTSAQMSTRGFLATSAKAWRQLTQPQIAAWNAAAMSQQTRSVLGQSGTLSGLQLFIKINCTLAQFGMTTVEDPPAVPEFPALGPQNLVITHTGADPALHLTCPTDPGDATIVRASAPQSAGVSACRDYRIIGMCPAPVAGACDITGLYVARYGVPPDLSKVFVKCNQVVDGYESLPVSWSAVVPVHA